MSHRVDACRECFQRNANASRFQRSSQQSQSQSNRSIKSLARSCGRRTRRFGRTPRAKTIKRTNERARVRRLSVRPYVRPSSRSKPTHEGTNRVEFRVARARSVRRLVDDRAIDRSTTTETRDGNPRDTARASTCARRDGSAVRRRRVARACVSFSLLLTVYTHNTCRIFPSSRYFVESRTVDYPHPRIHSRTTRCPSLGRSVALSVRTRRVHRSSVFEVRPAMGEA